VKHSRTVSVAPPKRRALICGASFLISDAILWESRSATVTEQSPTTVLIVASTQHVGLCCTIKHFSPPLELVIENVSRKAAASFSPPTKYVGNWSYKRFEPGAQRARVHTEVLSGAASCILKRSTREISSTCRIYVARWMLVYCCKGILQETLTRGSPHAFTFIPRLTNSSKRPKTKNHHSISTT